MLRMEICRSPVMYTTYFHYFCSCPNGLADRWGTDPAQVSEAGKVFWLFGRHTPDGKTFVDPDFSL